jgi:hypothetical protein
LPTYELDIISSPFRPSTRISSMSKAILQKPKRIRMLTTIFYLQLISNISPKWVSSSSLVVWRLLLELHLPLSWHSWRILSIDLPFSLSTRKNSF